VGRQAMGESEPACMRVSKFEIGQHAMSGLLSRRSAMLLCSTSCSVSPTSMQISYLMRIWPRLPSSDTNRNVRCSIRRNYPTSRWHEVRIVNDRNVEATAF
jgi:phosphopantetheinyl transferase